MRYIVSFVLGIIIGSFLNVVIYRTAKEGLKPWDPPYSFCPNCKRKLKWYDNIPILSYILLKGRCRYCGWRIPARYPVVEILTGITFFLNSIFIDRILTLIFSCIAVSALIAISFIDLETYMIPDYLNFTFLGSAIVVALEKFFLDHLISFIILTFIFLLLKLFYREGLGTGDVILAMGIGFLLTPLPAILAVLLASISGILFVLVKNRGKVDVKAKIPFGPFLSLGGYLLFLVSHAAGWL
ncbi:A24 family peptidase [Thermotoga sp. KOL6]|uniref:prepilin peptidase n=1 Tax=Thermotoga sp. KOL6 TaxID=126741 RepID=UPI000C766185|nr:A24 family peptidase [Thermotoga sp. KOL6]PLV60082.1 peptidase A24 [Thermotoga sp. KOL6]